MTLSTPSILYSLLLVISLLVNLACQPPTQEPLLVSRLTLKVASPFVNTDADLPLFWEMADPTGRLITPAQDVPQVYADGVLLANPRLYRQARPGAHRLEARWGAVSSPPLSLTVRSPRTYPLVRLPIVYHLAKHLTTQLTAHQLQTLLQAVNALFRNRWVNADPNQADSYIEFYAAPHDPLGQALVQIGIHPLDFDDPPTDQATTVKVDSLLQHWCVKQYVNVFVGIDWAKATYAGKYNYSYYPPDPQGAYPGDLVCGRLLPSRAAISLLEASLLRADILAHELGHTLGLRHPFGECGSEPVDVHVRDTPPQLETHPDAQGRKVACNRVLFTATNVMDYYNNKLSFTQDQVAVMRSIIEYPTYLPLVGGASFSPGSGRQGSLLGPVSRVVE